MQFHEKLTELRRKAGLSQEQLADQLGVTRQSVSKWESGAAMPELGKLIALSELFGVSIDYLVKENQTSDPRPAGEGDSCSARVEEKLDLLARDYRRSFGPVYQYTSRRTLLGLPLVSIRFGHDRHPTRYNTVSRRSGGSRQQASRPYQETVHCLDGLQFFKIKKETAEPSLFYFFPRTSRRI